MKGLWDRLRIENRLSCISCTGQRGRIDLSERCVCKVGTDCAGLLSPDLGCVKIRWEDSSNLPASLVSQDK